MTNKQLMFKSVADLDKEIDKIKTKVKINTNRQCKEYCTSANDIYFKAESLYKKGDEENAYILFMRYLYIFQCIKKSFEFAKSKGEFNSILKKCSANGAMDKAEALHESLLKRYSRAEDDRKLKKEIEANILFEKSIKQVGSPNSAQSMVTSTEKLILPDVVPIDNYNSFKKLPSPNSISKPDTSKENNFPASDPSLKYPSSSEMSVMDFYSIFKCYKHEIMVIDVRQSDEYAEAHMQHSCIINISTSLLFPGANINTIDSKLNKQTWLIWQSRQLKKYIAIFHDEYEQELLNKEVSPAVILRDIMLKFPGDYQVILVYGGFKQWHIFYPSITTNPTYSKKPIKPTLLDPFVTLKDLNYPDLPNINVKSEERKTLDSIPNGVKGNVNSEPGDASMYPNLPKPKVIKRPEASFSKVTEMQRLIIENDIEIGDDIVVPMKEAKNTTLPNETSTSSGPQLKTQKTNNKLNNENHDLSNDIRNPADLSSSELNANKNWEENVGLIKPKIPNNDNIRKPQNMGGLILPQIGDGSVDVVDNANDDTTTMLPITPMVSDNIFPQEPSLKKSEDTAKHDITFRNASLSSKDVAADPTSVPASVDSSSANNILRVVPNNVSQNLNDNSKPLIKNVNQPPVIENSTKENIKTISKPLTPHMKQIDSKIFIPGPDKGQISTESPSQGKFVTTSGLPKGWEKTLNRENGRIFYIDHNTRSTHWKLPSEIQAKVIKMKTDKPVVKEPIKNKPTVNKEISEERPSIKRSLSSPNIKEDLKDARKPMPVIDRSMKPKEQTQLLVNRSTKPVSAGRLNSLSPVYGSMGRSLTGLKNLGNTCYMNSVIQCLLNTVPLSKYFSSGTYEKDLNKSNMNARPGEVARELAFVLSVLMSGQYRSVSPSDFKHALGRFSSQFIGFDQQDSHELLMFLLDGLHEDVNKVKSHEAIKERETDNMPDDMAADLAWRDYRLNNDSVIVDLFQGQFRSTVVCLSCRKQSKTFDAFNCLQLQLPNDQPTSLEKCIDSFTRSEKIGGNDSWKCSNCKCYREAAKTIEIWKLPPILIIQLKRFSFDGHWHNKIQTSVNFPIDNFNLKSRIVASNGKFFNYRLYGVINHYGSFESGHYTSYSENPYKNKWYCYDDSVVKDIGNNSIKSSAAYLLFYTAVDFKEYVK